ncbi:MAG: hypothetical protein KJ787_11895 [Gammaproteobacteria bacterium]|nr:hypothetical protein [Gammaproteobacteria bacterium]MBU1647024.1 hypothetical protein [Gammaproteobacteria bacterium]MBU1972536.1 hypothetical protein [Gammaproteobacteria bacterium]
MGLLNNLRAGALVVLAAFSFQTLAADPAATERLKRYKEQKDAIYERMKRYGINREDILALRRLYETSPPYSYPHVKILADKVLNPGEHLRVEMDEFIVTMKMPDIAPTLTTWLSPYSNTRSPDPAMQKYLEQEKGSLTVASMGWENCVFLGCMNRRGDVSGLTMTYRILRPDEITGTFSTPETLQQGSLHFQKLSIERALARRGHNPIVSDAELEARRVALAPEIVTINGRIWVRDAMNDYMGRNYVYVTTLSPGRMFSLVFGMPKGHDYNAQPEPTTWPRSAKRAFENMEQMANSLRIVKMADDGPSDPFVVERVEPGPLPVREKRSATD